MQRPYENLFINDLLVEPGYARFPRPASRPNEISEDAPGVSIWRNNLTAASQRFNMYFTAFEGYVACTYPRGIEQKIPGIPDAMLDFPASNHGIPGDIDRERPHQANNMIVGLLGNDEVLLLVFDDGDVMAWYTHLLKHYIPQFPAEETEAPVCTLPPFLHQNVGKSAWGLAIHAQSRMIAVSTNNKAVYVFCFANSPPPAAPNMYGNMPIGYKEYLIMIQNYKSSVFKPCFPQFLAFTKAGINTVLGLCLTHEGHNIPSIDFVSDANGEASQIVAVDIVGNLWYLGIHVNQIDLRLKSPGNVGWGIINIPLNCFKKADYSDAIGRQPGTSAQRLAQNLHNELNGSPPDLTGLAPPEFNTGDHSAILQIYTKGVQLFPPTHNTKDPWFHIPSSVKIEDLSLDNPFVVGPRVLLQYEGLERLNMYKLIPELSVILVASQIGRVVVLSLTRLPDTVTKKPVTCLRRDAVLPRPQDDMHRPDIPLLGIAVAPVPRSNSSDLRWTRGSIAFRVFLHYADHSILSYELRRESHDQLGIF